MATESNSPAVHPDGSTSTYRPSLTRLSAELEGATARSRRVANAFLYSATFVALVAVVETLIATVLLGLQLTLAPVVVGLITFAVYANDRVADAETDAASNPDRASFARRHGSLLAAAAALAYGLAVALSLLGGPAALALTLLPGVAWGLYAADWLPSLGSLLPTGLLPGNGGGLPRLKELLIVNSAIVAFAWAVALTFIPIAFAAGASASTTGTSGIGAAADAVATGGLLADIALSPTVAVVFAYFFCRSFVDVEVPNVRDVDSDRAVGVATLPTALGLRRTRRVLSAVDVCVAALLVAAMVGGLLAPLHAGALLAGVAASLGITALVGRVRNTKLLGVAPECSYLVVAVVLLAVGL